MLAEVRSANAADAGSEKADMNQKQPESSDAWKWIGGLILTAIVSPIIVKLAEQWLGHDPIKEKADRLKQLIELNSIRQTHGLAPDGRLTALINEQTDTLGNEAKGRQQAIDDATGFLVGTLTSRLLEALFLSCQYLELLLDSKHRSNAYLASHDLTRLEFLRAYWAYRRLSIPQGFMSIKVDDIDQYVVELDRLGPTLGENAIRYAESIGTSPEDARQFISQLRNELAMASNRESSEGGRM